MIYNTQKRSSLIFIIIFLLFVINTIRLFGNDLWRDEVQPFLLAFDSKNLINYLQVVSQEGHPLLYNFFIWIISNFSSNPIYLKFLNLILMLGIWILIIKSPFTNLEKLIILGTYYLSFEYFAISRGYTLMIFLTIFAITQYQKKYYFFISISLLSNTEVFGLILSLIFSSYWIASNKNKINTQSYILIFIFLSAVLFSIYTMSFSLNNETNFLDNSVLKNLELIIRNIAQSIVPLKAEVFDGILNKNLSQETSFWAGKPQWEKLNYLHVAIIFIIITIATFEKKEFFNKLSNKNLYLLISPVFLILSFIFIFPTAQSQRHLGMIYIAHFSSLWLLIQSGAIKKLPNYFKLITILLFLSNLITYFYINKTFSNSKNTASYLLENYNKPNIIGYPFYAFQSVVAYLYEPQFFLECKCKSHSIVYKAKIPIKNNYDIFKNIDEIIFENNLSNILFVSNKSINDSRLTLIKSFDEAEIWDENFYIYTVNDD